MKRLLLTTLLLSAILVTTSSCKKKEENDVNKYTVSEELSQSQGEKEDMMHLRPYTGNSEEDQNIANETFSLPTVKAEYPGGMSAFSKQFITRFRTPDIDQGVSRIQVIVMFVVEKDGTLTNFKVARDPGYGTGAEAVRVLNSMPKWKPAILDGKAVRSQFTLPITIQVQ